METPRIYLDTSVFGGCIDAELAPESTRLIELVRAGRVRALVSDALTHEIAHAPAPVRDVFGALPLEHVERLPIDDDTTDLANAYVESGVLTGTKASLAPHFAAATRARADAVATWQFRSLKDLARRHGLNGINAELGYGGLVVFTPFEVTRATEAMEEDRG